MISHAGMGSIITALELGKRIIVMPRRANLGEHRNDHQLATAKRLSEQGRIMVAFTEQELVDKLDQLQVFDPTNGSTHKYPHALSSPFGHLSRPDAFVPVIETFRRRWMGNVEKEQPVTVAA